MPDLWGDIPVDVTKPEYSKAIEILREQAHLLKQKTNGKVNATFSKINYKRVTTVAGKALAPLFECREEIVEPELEGIEDFNDIYNYTQYKFELYNKTYKFRVFTINFRMIFPIELIVDEGIKEELNISTKTILNSDSQLIDLVSKIFKSKKLQIIISRMYEQK